LKISDTEFAIYTASGRSSYKCEACIKLLKRTEETPSKMQWSLSVSDATKKVVSPERQLILSPVCSKDSISAQIETVCLNGQSTVQVLESLLVMVSKLTEEVTHLKKDNADLTCQIKDLLGPVAGPVGPSGSVSHNDQVDSRAAQVV
jgi:hypothetical protein